MQTVGSACAHTPKPTITVGGIEVKGGYATKYTDNIGCGLATLKITGTQKNRGSKTAHFTIRAKHKLYSCGKRIPVTYTFGGVKHKRTAIQRIYTTSKAKATKLARSGFDLIGHVADMPSDGVKVYEFYNRYTKFYMYVSANDLAAWRRFTNAAAKSNGWVNNGFKFYGDSRNTKEGCWYSYDNMTPSASYRIHGVGNGCNGGYRLKHLGFYVAG